MTSDTKRIATIDGSGIGSTDDEERAPVSVWQAPVTYHSWMQIGLYGVAICCSLLAANFIPIWMTLAAAILTLSFTSQVLQADKAAHDTPDPNQDKPDKESHAGLGGTTTTAVKVAALLCLVLLSSVTIFVLWVLALPGIVTLLTLSLLEALSGGILLAVITVMAFGTSRISVRTLRTNKLRTAVRYSGFSTVSTTRYFFRWLGMVTLVGAGYGAISAAPVPAQLGFLKAPVHTLVLVWPLSSAALVLSRCDYTFSPTPSTPVTIDPDNKRIPLHWDHDAYTSDDSETTDTRRGGSAPPETTSPTDASADSSTGSSSESQQASADTPPAGDSQTQAAEDHHQSSETASQQGSSEPGDVPPGHHDDDDGDDNVIDL